MVFHTTYSPARNCRGACNNKGGECVCVCVWASERVCVSARSEVKKEELKLGKFEKKNS